LQGSKSDALKSKLIQYNIEDCLALKKVVETIYQLNINSDKNNGQYSALDCVSVSDMKPDRKFGSIDFLFEDLNFVNNCAYFDYQRQKIFCKTIPHLGKKKVKDFIHIDETKVNVKGCREYVWVLTNMEEVAFMHTATRAGDFLKELLKDFKGVLISDFYAAYDSINCPQQKCLIHLIRDLNDDLQKNPFDEEYKDISSRFSILLREIIATVDKNGLKKRYLNKHNASIKRYFDYILNNTYKSELALQYQKRFKKIHEKLFTFISYNGIPWNNNNAEHAIKHFADYRGTVAGQIREFGLRNYLMLLSIYQTCEYRGLSFLKFLLSKETDIDKFRLLKNCPKQRDDFDPHYNSDIGKYDRSDNTPFQ